MMKRLLDFAAVTCVVLMVSCAAHQAPASTPAGLALAKAKQVAVAIGTLQHAAIELNNTQTCNPTPCHAFLSDRDTAVVVDASTDALTALRAAPDGWLATADVALTRVESRLEAAGKAAFGPYLAGAHTTVNALKGSPR